MKLMGHLRIDPPGREAVLLDACWICGGLWFDRGELGLASKEQPARAATSTKSALLCPRCKVKMFDEGRRPQRVGLCPMRDRDDQRKLPAGARVGVRRAAKNVLFAWFDD